jgi:hypothetical protein
MKTRVLLGAGIAALVAAASMASAQSPGQKVEVVQMTGCLKEAAGSWTLVGATDPIPVTRAPAPTPQAAAGKSQAQLLGVAEFDMPSHKNHLVTARGLFVKASPIGRLNVTSVVNVADSCGNATR